MKTFSDLPSADDIDYGCMHCGSGFEDDDLICAGYGAKWHCTCILGAFPWELLFWYCRNYCALDAHDPAMNVALLMLIAGYDVDAVIMEVGYEIYNQVVPL